MLDDAETETNSGLRKLKTAIESAKGSAELQDYPKSLPVIITCLKKVRRSGSALFTPLHGLRTPFRSKLCHSRALCASEVWRVG